MFEIDASAGAFGPEQNLDLGHKIGVEFEFGGELPDQHEPRGRLPSLDRAYVAFRSVDTDLVPAAAVTRLDDRFVEVSVADLVRLGPPSADPRREHVERMGRRRLDEDALTNGCRADLGAHFCSFLTSRSSSAAKAVSAESQNWSSHARIAPSPLGSI